jgi:hypothetical protein
VVYPSFFCVTSDLSHDLSHDLSLDLSLILCKLTIGADFTGVSRESMEEVAALLAAIQRRISEIADHAGKRIDELSRSLPRGTKQ